MNRVYKFEYEHFSKYVIYFVLFVHMKYIDILLSILPRKTNSTTNVNKRNKFRYEINLGPIYSELRKKCILLAIWSMNTEKIL